MSSNILSKMELKFVFLLLSCGICHTLVSKNRKEKTFAQYAYRFHSELDHNVYVFLFLER